MSTDTLCESALTELSDEDVLLLPPPEANHKSSFQLLWLSDVDRALVDAAVDAFRDSMMEDQGPGLPIEGRSGADFCQRDASTPNIGRVRWRRQLVH